MENVSILYIGGSADAISVLASHPEISLVHMSDAMAATTWLQSGNKPDAVLCELNVPGSDGFEFNRFLRKDLVLHKDRSYQYISFILICHEFNNDVFTQAFNTKKFEMGIDDLFVLPLEDVNGLVERIRFLSNYRRIEKEVAPYHMPMIKRIFDILVASAALIALSPILLIVVIAIRLESKGKVYYISKRRGRGLHEFDL